MLPVGCFLPTTECSGDMRVVLSWETQGTFTSGSPQGHPDSQAEPPRWHRCQAGMLPSGLLSQTWAQTCSMACWLCQLSLAPSSSHTGRFPNTVLAGFIRS